MLEFFNHHSNCTADPDMVIIDRQYSPLCQVLDENMAQRIIMILLDDPRACEVVIKIRNHGITSPVEIVKQFKACNWDRLEIRPDITDDNKPNFEYVDCGYKGANRRCPFSTPLDTKPFCVLKTIYNIPNYESGKCNERHI